MASNEVTLSTINKLRNKESKKNASSSQKIQHLPLSERSKSLKITVVGDGNVGKTCLLMSYTINAFPEEYLPTVFDTHPMHISVQGVEYPVVLWDTAGQEEYSRLRPLSYPKTDCFIVCYSIDNPTSFDNVKSLWIPEVRKYCPKAAIVVVGTKLDLANTALNIVSLSDAKKLKHKIGANANLQCSAKTRDQLEDVFTQAIHSIVKRRLANKSYSCICL